MSRNKLLLTGSIGIVIVAMLYVMGGVGFAVTPMGSTIMNQATAQYEDAQGVLRLANSNAVLLHVQQVRGITVTPGPGPVELHNVVRNQIVQYAFKITNTGNGPETVSLALAASNLGMPPQVQLFRDENGDGIIDSGDTLLTPTLGLDGYEYTVGPLAAGASMHVMARFTVSSHAVPGDEIALHLAAVSTADAAVGDESPIVLFRVQQGNVVTALLARDKGVVGRGELITYTLTLINPADDVSADVKTTLSIPQHTSLEPGSVRAMGGAIAPDPTFPYVHTVSDLPAGAAYELVYVVRVDGDAPAATVTNAATVQVGTEPAFVTNEVHTEVLAEAGLVLAEAGGVYDVSPAAAGTTYTFPYRVTNTGNGTDDVFIEAHINSGWPVALYRADGVTVLAKHSGKYTVGQLAANESAAFVVAVTVPAGAPSDSAVHTLTTTATSGVDSTVRESETATLADVAGAGLELSVAGAAHVTGIPGTIVVYDMVLKNTGPNTDVFALSKVLDTGTYGDAAFTVRLLDAYGNLLGALPVAGNEAQPLQLVVAIAPGAAPTTDPVAIKVGAASQHNTLLTDEVTVTLDVDKHVAVAVGPQRTGTVNWGSFVLYTLYVQNQGNTSADVHLDFASYGGTPQLLYNFKDEVTADLTTTWAHTLAPNEVRTLTVRVDAPTSVAVGTADHVIVQAGVNGVVLDEAVLTTYVAGGELKLHNEADAAQVKPGDYVVYTVTGTNLTVGPVNALTIYETVPDHTVFVSAATVAGAELAYSVDRGATWTAALPAHTDDVTSIRWTFAESVRASDGVTVSFIVRVK